MRMFLKSWLGLWLGVVLAGGSLAAEVTGLAPFAGQSWGQQSDSSSPAYEQSFAAPDGAVLEAIRWWGFHGPNSQGSGFDDFVVMLDGVVQSGTLTVRNATPFFDEYTLDVPDAALSASALSIVNNSLDVEWFWQSATAGPNDPPHRTAVAFSLIGRPGELTVDEPVTPSLLLAAFVATVLARLLRQACDTRGGTGCGRRRCVHSTRGVPGTGMMTRPSSQSWARHECQTTALP